MYTEKLKKGKGGKGRVKKEGKKEGGGEEGQEKREVERGGGANIERQR